MAYGILPQIIQPSMQVYSYTIAASSWTLTDEIYSANISAAGINTGAVIMLSEYQNGVDKAKAYANAKLAITAQTASQITITAFGEKPTIDIDMNLFVFQY